MAVVTLAAIGSSCGSAPATSTASPSPSAAVPSPSPPPSPLSFKLNGIKTTASGTITLIAEPHSVSIELKITGLQPNSSHVSHIHIGSCQQVGNISLALNQVLADANREAAARSPLSAPDPPAAVPGHVVVH